MRGEKCWEEESSRIDPLGKDDGCGNYGWQYFSFYLFLAALALSVSSLTNHSSRTTLSKKAHVVFEHAKF